MVGKTTQRRRAWALARRQHYVITRQQLLDLGFSSRWIEHRLRTGRLHQLYRGVYAVGRNEVTREGRWMAAVRACGAGAVLSHLSAAALWGMLRDRPGPIHVTVPLGRTPKHPGIQVHRSSSTTARLRRGIPVTSPAITLIDLATCLERDAWEQAMNEADSLDLCTPEQVRAAAERERRPGAGAAKRLLDPYTFVLTRSTLERLFLPIAHRAGLPRPLTRVWLNGFEVDFHWPELGLVVETDGLRYHRTAARQTRDAVRGHAHAKAGVLPLRFTHWQVAREPAYVEATLRAVALRLAA